MNPFLTLPDKSFRNNSTHSFLHKGEASYLQDLLSGLGQRENYANVTRILRQLASIGYDGNDPRRLRVDHVHSMLTAAMLGYTMSKRSRAEHREKPHTKRVLTIAMPSADSSFRCSRIVSQDDDCRR
jgi:hypothetical protein